MGAREGPYEAIRSAAAHPEMRIVSRDPDSSSFPFTALEVQCAGKVPLSRHARVREDKIVDDRLKSLMPELRNSLIAFHTVSSS
jgi:ABC-type hemin transport system ATPase subunit